MWANPGMIGVAGWGRYQRLCEEWGLTKPTLASEKGAPSDACPPPGADLPDGRLPAARAGPGPWGQWTFSGPPKRGIRQAREGPGRLPAEGGSGRWGRRVVATWNRLGRGAAPVARGGPTPIWVPERDAAKLPAVPRRSSQG